MNGRENNVLRKVESAHVGLSHVYVIHTWKLRIVETAQIGNCGCAWKLRIHLIIFCRRDKHAFRLPGGFLENAKGFLFGSPAQLLQYLGKFSFGT